MKRGGVSVCGRSGQHSGATARTRFPTRLQKNDKKNHVVVFSGIGTPPSDALSGHLQENHKCSACFLEVCFEKLNIFDLCGEDRFHNDLHAVVLTFSIQSVPVSRKCRHLCV